MALTNAVIRVNLGTQEFRSKCQATEEYFPLATAVPTAVTYSLGKRLGVRQELRKGVVNTSFDCLRTFHDDESTEIPLASVNNGKNSTHSK